MAHELFNASMVFAGETPWHGLGTQLPRNATWETIKAILPFYTVQERQVFAAGIPTPLPDRKALVASNDGRYLATVGKDYGVVQFDDLAESVMRAVGSDAVFHTAGLLGDNGARGWLLGEIPNPIRVKNDSSEIRKFFLATASHDGASSVALVNAATRVVCANTLGAALGERGGFHTKIRHTSRAADRVKAAADSFREVVLGMEKFGQLANALASVQLDKAATMQALALMVPMPDRKDDEAAASFEERTRPTIERRDRIEALSVEGQGIAPAMRGSAWALFQGATEWADHERKIVGTGDRKATAAEKFNAQFFGPAADFKRQALASIQTVAGIKA